MPGEDTSRLYACGIGSLTSSTAEKLARHRLAGLQVDAVLGDRRQVGVIGQRPVDLDAERPAALLEQEAQVDQLESGRRDDRLDDLDEALVERIAGHGADEKKGGRKATSPQSD